MDYTADYYYKYIGENWVILQNGENIIIAKKSSLVKLDGYKYALMDDSKGKVKEAFYNVSDIDVIFLKK